MAGIGIVVNPRAGGVRRDPALPERLKRILGDEGELIVADGKDEIAATVETLRARGVDVLGVVGGDGSNLYTLTSATEIFDGDLPPIALLRGGSVNVIGRALGLRGRPESLLRRLLRARTNGGFRTVSVETMRVNGLVGFVFGGGLVGKFYDVFYSGRGKGPLDAGVMIGRALLSAVVETRLSKTLFEPVPGSIVADGRELPFHEYTLILASTVDNLFGFRVTYRARERSGHFHLVASGSSRQELARQFHNVVMGRPMRGPRHADLVVRSAEIRFDRPCKYIIDGDLYEGDRVVVEPGPRLGVVSL